MISFKNMQETPIHWGFFPNLIAFRLFIEAIGYFSMTGKVKNIWSKEAMQIKYRITRHDGEEDVITSQEFDNYDDAYEVLEGVYGDMCCSDADYEDRPYYEIVELKNWQVWFSLLHARNRKYSKSKLKFILNALIDGSSQIQVDQKI